MTSNQSYGLANREQAAEYRLEQIRANRRREDGPGSTRASSRGARRSSTAMAGRLKPLTEQNKARGKQRKKSHIGISNMGAADISELGQEEVPATISGEMKIFTYLSDDSEDDEVSESDMHAIQYWQRRCEDQQLVRKAFARSKAHKRNAVATLVRNLPRESAGMSLPGTYTPFSNTSFDLTKFT